MDHVDTHHEQYNSFSTVDLQHHHLMLGFDAEMNRLAYIAAAFNPFQTPEDHQHVAQLNAEMQLIARKRNAIETILHERNAIVPRFPHKIQNSGHGG